MPQTTRFISTSGLVLALCAAFSGCNSRTNVSATGSTPSQFTHVFITTEEVWFNTNGNAGPDDAGWAKFPLTTPVTVDLVAQSNGTLGEIADDLRVAPGTYNSILLVPLDLNTALTANAQAVGASYNSEADYVDAAGTAHQVPLVLPNSEKGFVIPGASLKVPVGSVGAGAVGSTTSTSTTGTTGTTTTGTTATTGTTSSTASTTTTVSFAASFDGSRDLHLFSYNNGASTGALLSANPVATDLSTTGGISGTLTLTSTLTSPTSFTTVSGRIAIEASAELLSADGTHHVIVASAPLQTDGTFTIYPLQSNSGTPTVYDVVIHGPSIATIIIKNVSVATSSPTLTGAASTTGSVATTTASGAVSLGTLIPRTTTTFETNITSTLPPGAAVTFYQTLPASGEVPYAIDEIGIDPINLSLLGQGPEQLSMGTIDSGTYSSTGSTITITSSAPTEGAGTYRVGATAPLFTDAVPVLSTVVTGTAASTVAPVSTTPSTATVTPATVNVPALTPANGSAVASIAAAITVPAGAYAGGELLVSHNGALIGAAAIDANTLLSGTGSVAVSGLPSGSIGNYYLSAIVWTSSDFKYESIASPVTVAGGSPTDVAVTIN